MADLLEAGGDCAEAAPEHQEGIAAAAAPVEASVSLLEKDPTLDTQAFLGTVAQYLKFFVNLN